jgi:hypothetical protein
VIATQRVACAVERTPLLSHDVNRKCRIALGQRPRTLRLHRTQSAAHPTDGALHLTERTQRAASRTWGAVACTVLVALESD